MYVPSTVAVLAVAVFHTSVSRAQLAYDSNNKQNNGIELDRVEQKKKITPQVKRKKKVMNK